jgi:hypothetical protein
VRARWGWGWARRESGVDRRRRLGLRLLAGAGNVSEEMSDDSEELVPKAVHDLKTGKVHGKAGTHTLYLVEWEHYSNEIDLTWEP